MNSIGLISYHHDCCHFFFTDDFIPYIYSMFVFICLRKWLIRDKGHNFNLVSQATVCLRSSDPFNIVTYHVKWVTTSWTDGTPLIYCWSDLNNCCRSCYKSGYACINIIFRMDNTVCMSKKNWPILYSKLQYKKGRYFLYT